MDGAEWPGSQRIRSGGPSGGSGGAVSMLHPNVHQAFSSWSEDRVLHVACMYSNPQRWPVRRELMNDFRKRMESSPNVILYVGEVAFGDRPFEVTDSANPLDFQFRSRHELWLK